MELCSEQIKRSVKEDQVSESETEIKANQMNVDRSGRLVTRGSLRQSFFFFRSSRFGLKFLIQEIAPRSDQGQPKVTLRSSSMFDGQDANRSNR